MKKTDRDNYFAVSINDNDRIISSGRTIESVIHKADKTGEEYIIAPILEKNTTYIL